MDTSLPRHPYSLQELEAFAGRNLRILPPDAGEPRDPTEKAAQHFAQLLHSLPNWQQIALVEQDAPNFMATGRALQDAYTVLSGQKNNILGFYAVKNDAHIPANSVVWGGMFECRGNSSYHPDPSPGVTYAHEDGHRLDYTLASRWAALGRREPGMKPQLSQNGWWIERLELYKKKQKARPPTARTEGRNIYPGACSLMEHLHTTDKNNAPVYSETEHPGEAMAEMQAHYSSLYRYHDGNETLTHHCLQRLYPELWHPYANWVIPIAKDLAEQLYTRREKQFRHFDELSVRMAGSPAGTNTLPQYLNGYENSGRRCFFEHGEKVFTSTLQHMQKHNGSTHIPPRLVAALHYLHQPNDLPEKTARRHSAVLALLHGQGDEQGISR